MDNIYSAFRNHPFVQSIADNERWTVSTDKKMPIDMYTLINKGIVSGALYNNELSLVSLDTLYNTIPNTATYTYYMDALIDHFVVLDIEPKCPKDIKDQLMAIQCLYMEISMSGKGIHMVFPVSDELFNKYPAAKTKTAMKEEHGYYEILLNHYITFTGNQLVPTNTDNVDQFEHTFAELAKIQKTAQKADIEIQQLESVNTKRAPAILQVLTESTDKYKKTPENFYNDMSKYEFSYTSYLKYKLEDILDTYTVTSEGHEYTDAEKAWFIYQVTSNTLPPRPKHNELRNGLPWLLYLAFEVIAKTEKPKKRRKDHANDNQ